MKTQGAAFVKKHRLKEVLDRYWEEYQVDPSRKLYLTEKHYKAVNKLRTCRTSRLGIQQYSCSGCGSVHRIVRSCKHRFCSGCGIAETNRWAEKTLSHLLKIKHHHIVTTLPSSLRWLSKLNENVLHDLLFRCSSLVLKNWFKARHDLECGIVSVLHTSGSDLKYHPHVHMIVSGGGIGEDGALRSLVGNYLCAQRKLGDLLRKMFIKLLLKLYDKGELIVGHRYGNRQDFLQWLGSINTQQWIVSIQPPLQDASQIVGYVGRYTKRACLSESKLEYVDDEEVYFRFNDYKHTPRGMNPVQGIVKLSGSAFLDALLQHVPEKGYRMVRYYGLYSGRKYSTVPAAYKSVPQASVASSCELPAETSEIEWGPFELYRKAQIAIHGIDPLYCHDCNQEYEFDCLIIDRTKGSRKYGYYVHEDSS